jgi:alkanesulfonate monooxygenase SsuD/methylene tetrahydromethanopterin reductase-like flavin-dependent oxidoreductase (luciferase family)
VYGGGVSDLEVGVRLPATVSDPGEYLADAAAFDAAGADALWVDEGESPAHEPWSLLAAMAAVTDRAALVTSMSAGSTWPPALLARVVATTDHLSHGRVMVAFDEGGTRLDELVAALRHAPLRPGGPPILLGAFGDVGYRRAALVGDGFVHGGGEPGAVAATFRRLRELRAGRDDPFQLWVQVRRPTSRDDWRAILDAHAEAGATGVVVPAGPGLLDLLRNPDEEGDRRDLHLAQG